MNERWSVMSNPVVYTLFYSVDNQEKCKNEPLNLSLDGSLLVA